MIHENSEYRNKIRLFNNRHSAGEQLVPYLKKLEIDTILAIPNGGVPVAEPIVSRLKINAFNLLIIRKIQLPTTTESGFGAITPDGQIFLNNQLLSHLNYDDNTIKNQIESARMQIKEKKDEYQLKELNVSNRSVVLIDDGIASGYSMMAGVSWLKQQNTRYLSIAVPTAPLRSLHTLETMVDEIICLNISEGYSFAVADAYQHWYDVPTVEVKSILQKIRNIDVS